MTEQVIYELGLRDKLSAGIDGATGHVNLLEKTLGSVKGLLTGIGIGLAAFKLSEFVHEANEQWEKMEFSISQVEAGIKSTGGAAGVTFEDIKKSAEDFSHSLKFTQADILQMQSVLLTFPAVTKDTFDKSSQAVIDMSTRLGKGVVESVTMLGKAMQDPEKGISALHRVGVNTDELKKKFETVTDVIGRQKLILEELTLEYGGSALAAAEADKSFRLDKTMEENKVILGEFIDQIKEQMMPALIAVANAFRDMIVWVKENWTQIKRITIALGAAWVTFKLFTAGPAIFLAIENALVSAAVGGSIFGASMTAALGPVGLLAAAVGGLVYMYQSIGEEQEKLDKQKKSDLEKSAMDELAVLNNTTAVFEKTMDKKLAVEKSKYIEVATLRNDIQKMETQREADMAGDYSSYEQSDKGKDMQRALNIAHAKLEAAEKYDGPANLIPSKSGGKALAAGGKVAKDPSTKATGSKSVTINVVIQKLGETTMNITNIKEGAKQLHDAVTKALTGAVNDFQVIANNS